jgi:hypothetical protein
VKILIELRLTPPDPAYQNSAGEILKTRLASYADVYSVSVTEAEYTPGFASITRQNRERI